MDIVKYNMLLTSELINIMKLLEENNIKAIAFKGPTLSQLAYGDITLRQYVDLDILIEKDNLGKAYDLFLTKSYSSEIDKKFIKNNLFIDKNSDIQFVENKKNILLELHWKLFRNKFSNTQNNINIYEEIQSINLNSYNMNIFKNELLLVYLCMHGSKHKWERIEWIADIDKLLRISEDINWKLVVEISKKYNCNKMLNLGLLLSHELYDTPIQIDSIKKNEEKYYKETVKYVLAEMSNITVYKSEFNKNYTSFKFHLNLNENLYNKIYFLKKSFFDLSNSDVNFLYLNEKFFLVHYFIKPFRLLIKYLKKIIK
jgi:hypothetical protein